MDVAVTTAIKLASY